jgi:ATPase family AAA domain-containing protein 2
MYLARGEAEPEFLAQTRFRRNEDGTIRDVTSNKRFYNMDLDRINDGLWNGYYLAPDQFVFDIQCMVHDAKTWPDRDRTNRAEEMLANTQAYVSDVFDETLLLECQRMAEREFERQKIAQAEREAKAKKKAEREKEKERVRLAAAAQQAAQDGPSPTKMIEAPPTGDVQMLDQNGDGLEENGNNNGIVEESGSQIVPESSPLGGREQTFEDIMFPPPPPPKSISPTHTQPFQPMSAHANPAFATPTYNTYPPPIPQPTPSYSYPPIPQTQPTFPPQFHPPQNSGTMYPHPIYAENGLSPTFNPHSHPTTYQMPNHQMSPPPFNQFPRPGDHPYQPPHVHFGGPLPKTMSPTPTPLPQNHVSPTRTMVPRPAITPHPLLKKDPARVERLLQDVTRQTKGYTLEQLEQVYAACMDIIWRLRHEWDRTVVIMETEKCVRQVLSEIEMMKKERERDRIDVES